MGNKIDAAVYKLNMNSYIMKNTPFYIYIICWDIPRRAFHLQYLTHMTLVIVYEDYPLIRTAQWQQNF
jgi:hypothetical protein